jgi:hypothetical protein
MHMAWMDLTYMTINSQIAAPGKAGKTESDENGGAADSGERDLA